ncbi:hypothetical protein GH714_029476 [Hevea brasiliensis]|uniref:VQ domain-containing protein n=1 Tax=Hevea brasiliensis TaxID=3981 RepID=A0A6A6LS80_HEVBR|nr:hypothetical protein GH714_029476 [Hevea brasiliensis]
MGKKLSEASPRISKNEKKQLNSWIKVLRPKVYITDSSSFKRLVQELTGNGTTTPTIISKPQTVDKKLTITSSSIEDHGDPESSLETSTLDSFEFPNQVISFPEGLSQSYIEDNTSDDLWMNQQGDLESLLLDIDPNPFYGCLSQIYQEEVSIYDYEISEKSNVETHGVKSKKRDLEEAVPSRLSTSQGRDNSRCPSTDHSKTQQKRGQYPYWTTTDDFAGSNLLDPDDWRFHPVDSSSEIYPFLVGLMRVLAALQVPRTLKSEDTSDFLFGQVGLAPYFRGNLKPASFLLVVVVKIYRKLFHGDAYAHCFHAWTFGIRQGDPKSKAPICRRSRFPGTNSTSLGNSEWAHLQVVKAMLLVNPQTHLFQDRNGRSPLHVAVIKGRFEVLQELVQAKPEAVQLRGRCGETILHLCVKHHQLDALKFLLERINDDDFVNLKDGSDITALQLAITGKQSEAWINPTSPL